MEDSTVIQEVDLNKKRLNHQIHTFEENRDSLIKRRDSLKYFSPQVDRIKVTLMECINKINSTLTLLKQQK